jgi:adenylate cyclase
MNGVGGGRMRMRALPVKLPLARSVRLTSGLIMFSYATCHLLSHSTGLFLLDGIQRIGQDILLAPWRTTVGLSILLAAFLIHLGLGLTALYRRRHLRMPAIEAWQLGLGLTIPLLLVSHVTNARLGVLFYGLEDSYFRVLYLFWLSDPLGNLPRQFALLVAVWTHGCIGIHMWLRLRPWYPRWSLAFGAAAVALPVLAILGDQCRLGHETARRTRSGLCRRARTARSGHAGCGRRRGSRIAGHAHAAWLRGAGRHDPSLACFTKCL